MVETRSPGAWLTLLEPELMEQRRAVRRFKDYYDGKHPLAFATSKYREAFGALFGPFADNWCEIVVSAADERLRVEGFRFPASDEEEAEETLERETGDAEAWAIWQANHLDADSRQLHTEAIKCGRAYALVSPNGDMPRITVEDPSEMIVATSPEDRRRRLAALKCWDEDDGYAYATLYLPDAIHRFRSAEKVVSHNTGRTNWMRIEDPILHNLGAVPVVDFHNNPDLLGGGRSDLTPAIPLNNAINKQALDMIVTSEGQAFRQRVLTGVEIPIDPETGLPMPGTELKAIQSKIWAFADPNARVTELGVSDLEPYVKSIEMFIRHLAAQTRTPPHYLHGQIINASGDALKASESGLVRRVSRKQDDFAESWEEVMRLAFAAKGDTRRASAMDAEVLWKEAEQRSDAEVMDAAVKMKTLGVPYPDIWRFMGFSEQAITRFTREMQRVKARAATDPQAMTFAAEDAAEQPTDPAEKA